MRSRTLWLIAGFALFAACSYWLVRSADPNSEHVEKPLATSPNRPVVGFNEPAPEFRRGNREPGFQMDSEAADAGALLGQRVIAFKDQASLEAFLKRAGDRIHIMGRLDALNALRVGFLNHADLAALLDGSEESSMIFPVETPEPRIGGLYTGGERLGNRLLEWLGITGDNSAVGNGIRIAVLDTGVASHSSFLSRIISIDLMERSSDPSALNGHGTAVASTLVSSSSLTPGVVPGAEILSIRIANDAGVSNSWLLAQGIIAAVDAGAHIINISMGSSGDSTLVRSAIEYAREAGVVIIAAAGNDGSGQVANPAANDGVIAVGSVDAAGNHLSFSNSGKVDVSAPGYGVNTAWVGDQSVSVDGTSFSTPIVSGAIAYIMSTQQVSANQAVVIMNQYLNDGGSAGSDAYLGAGMPALDRVENANTPGIYDAALASHTVIPPGDGVNYARLEVLVQNRGTEPLVNTAVQITSPAGTTTANITTLVPNAVQAITIALPNNYFESGQPLQFDSSVTLSGGVTDSNTSNDRRVETFTNTLAP